MRFFNGEREREWDLDDRLTFPKERKLGLIEIWVTLEVVPICRIEIGECHEKREEMCDLNGKLIILYFCIHNIILS